MDELADTFKVFCLADRWKSDYFWNSESFCKNYEGFCIGYKAVDLFKQDSFFMECNTPYDYMITNNGKHYFSLPPIKYDKNDKHTFDYWDKAYDKNGNYDPTATNTKNTNTIIYNFLHKYERFNNEHEYRAWFKTSNNINKVYIPKEIIVCIIFGMNCPDYLTLKSQFESNNSNIKFYKQIIDADGHVDCIRL